jgi:hypothetical protein
MKILKVLIITLIVSLYSLSSFGQTCSYQNEILTTKQQTGAYVEKDMIFTLTMKSYEDIKSSKFFIDWQQKIIFTDSEKNMDKVALYIDYHIRSSISDIKMRLKNRSSLDFIEGSKGDIYAMENSILILFNFKAQNGFGNFIIRECMYSISWKDGKEETFCFIH